MSDKELFESDPREYAFKKVEDCGDGEVMLTACLKYMSHDDIRRMLDLNELSPRFNEGDSE